MRSLAATNAYRKSTGHRNMREQEADVFRMVNGALRRAAGQDDDVRVKALVDNERLWITLMDTLKDPDNSLPRELTASIVSVGMAVRREVMKKDPDFGFLINVNEQMALGLVGQ